MATNKTIDPTNVTVQIPAMADKPNQATNSNCLDKTIDGVNAVNSKINILSANTDAISDCDSISSTGIYKAVNSTLNTPIANNHFVIYHVQYSQSEAYQIAVALGVRLFIRTYQGTWSSWSEK